MPPRRPRVPGRARRGSSGPAPAGTPPAAGGGAPLGTLASRPFALPGAGARGRPGSGEPPQNRPRAAYVRPLTRRGRRSRGLAWGSVRCYARPAWGRIVLVTDRSFRQRPGVRGPRGAVVLFTSRRSPRRLRSSSGAPAALGSRRHHAARTCAAFRPGAPAAPRPRVRRGVGGGARQRVRASRTAARGPLRASCHVTVEHHAWPPRGSMDRRSAPAQCRHSEESTGRESTIMGQTSAAAPPAEVCAP